MLTGSTGGCERALPFHVGIPCHFFAAALKHIFLGRVRDDKILKVSALIRLLYQVAKESTFFPEKVYLVILKKYTNVTQTQTDRHTRQSFGRFARMPSSLELNRQFIHPPPKKMISEISALAYLLYKVTKQCMLRMST